MARHQEKRVEGSLSAFQQYWQGHQRILVGFSNVPAVLLITSNLPASASCQLLFAVEDTDNDFIGSATFLS